MNPPPFPSYRRFFVRGGHPDFWLNSTNCWSTALSPRLNADPIACRKASFSSLPNVSTSFLARIMKVWPSSTFFPLPETLQFESFLPVKENALTKHRKNFFFLLRYLSLCCDFVRLFSSPAPPTPMPFDFPTYLRVQLFRVFSFFRFFPWSLYSQFPSTFPSSHRITGSPSISAPEYCRESATCGPGFSYAS